MPDLNEAKRIVLAQWEQERDDLNRSIARLRRELQIPEAGDSTQTDSGDTDTEVKGVFGVPVIQLIKPGDFFGMSQIEASRKTLQYSNRQPLGLQEIAAATLPRKGNRESDRGYCTTESQQFVEPFRRFHFSRERPLGTR